MSTRTPETSRLFSRWRNPANGLESLVLTARVAPVQQSFYYTHPAFTDDGRHLWLGCGFPPPGGRHARQVLGVVDFERDELRVFHEAQLASSRPLVDLATGEAYWCHELEVWKRSPDPAAQAVRVGVFPRELAKGRLVQLATHPTFSADRSAINLDARFLQRDGSVRVILGELPLDGSPFRPWQIFEGRTYNHALFSPTDPALQLFSHEYWQDHAPFDPALPYHRMWTIRRGEQPRPVLRAPVSHSGHEWWDADGRHVWYLHYGVGVKKVRLDDGSETLVWPGPLSHAHSDHTGRFLVADRMDSPDEPDCHVLFRDTATGRELEIVNRGPLAAHLTQAPHLHPHPHFCLHDRYVCHTTTVHDRVDLALVFTESLRAAV